MLAALALLSGCVSTARLYDLDAGTMLTAEYRAGLPRGPITINHPDGPCTGEFSTVVGGAWGQIYSSTGGTATGTALSLANRGAAIATCPGGRVIECEYVASMGSGTGFCRDNRGARYRLMF